MNTKVYLVSSGTYSDYHICCACSTMAKAEHAKKFYQADDIEEYVLDELPLHPEGTFAYHVRMLRDGSVVEVEIENGNYTGTIEDRWRPHGDGETVGFFMWAKNSQHAIKVANEIRSQIVASGEWTTDWHRWSENKP